MQRYIRNANLFRSRTIVCALSLLSVGFGSGVLRKEAKLRFIIIIPVLSVVVRTWEKQQGRALEKMVVYVLHVTLRVKLPYASPARKIIGENCSK